jgi:fructosamine-3-kinase
MWSEIVAAISKATGRSFDLQDSQSLSGGCINQSYLLQGREDSYFAKLNRPDQIDMFEAESAGLIDLASTKTIAVPQIICWGTTTSHSYLVLENLDLRHKNNGWAMGMSLAALHRFPQDNSAERCQQKFGWHRDNRIGSTPQINSWKSNWVEFFRDYRLAYQFELAGWSQFPHAQELLDRLPLLLNHQPQPALVHGDLWSGNASFTKAGVPVIFDPAVYWGDREVDIAMTELFGGFPADFYRGYESVYSLEPGYEQRKTIYNLYHILNHYNLFGGSYHSQAQRTIESILSIANMGTPKYH